jgi:nicotinamidase-related amidase
MDFIEPVSRSGNLVSLKDCFVLIIDVQPVFMSGLTPNEFSIFIDKYIHIIKLCRTFNIPLIATAEDIQKNGSLPGDIQKLLNPQEHIYDKFIYSCWGQKNIQNVIRTINKSVCIICGFETDVCIMQTAIDLLDNGFKVVVLSDMTFSRNETEHEIGLKRMAYHGAIISVLKTWQEEIAAGVKTKVNYTIKENELSDI